MVNFGEKKYIHESIRQLLVKENIDKKFYY